MFSILERSGTISVWAGLLAIDEPLLNGSISVVILYCLKVVGMEKPFAGKTRCLSFQLVLGY